MLLPVRVEACICLLLTMTDIGRVVMLRRLMAALRPEPEPGQPRLLILSCGRARLPVSVGGLTSVHWSQGAGACHIVKRVWAPPHLM